MRGTLRPQCNDRKGMTLTATAPKKLDWFIQSSLLKPCPSRQARFQEPVELAAKSVWPLLTTSFSGEAAFFLRAANARWPAQFGEAREKRRARDLPDRNGGIHWPIVKQG